MTIPTTTEPLGVVWVKSTSSVLSVGLESTLKKPGTRVYRGQEPPTTAPTVVVYVPEGGDENVASEVRGLKNMAPDAAVVVFGPSADLLLARAALQAGADGFLHANMPPEQIARALEKAHEGVVVLPRELLSKMVARDRRPDLSELSSRMEEILGLVAEGLSNAQIANRLFLSVSTIKQHLTSAYIALGVKNRNQAAGLLRRSDPNRAARRRVDTND